MRQRQKKQGRIGALVRRALVSARFTWVLFFLFCFFHVGLSHGHAPSAVVEPSVEGGTKASAGADSRESGASAEGSGFQKSGTLPQSTGGDTPAARGLELPEAPAGFSTHDGGWIKMAYHPSLSSRVGELQKQAEAVKAELAAQLGRPVLSKVHVRVGRTTGEMETLAPRGTHFPRYAAGVAYSELGLVLLTATPRYPGARHDLAEVFRHELAHIALHDAVGRDNIPRWFNEGFAVYASREAETARMQALWTATLSENLLPFEKLTRSFPADAQTASVAYAQAADMLRFLLRSGEEHRFEALIRRVAQGQSFDEALADAYSTDMYSLEEGWREDVARRYTFWPVLFGGSLIWVGAFGLLLWGYARRKRRSAKKLARWAQEEALEDARKEWAQALLSRAGEQVRVVVTKGSRASSSTDSSSVHGEPIMSKTHIVPSIEHDGERHTLH